MLQCVRMMILNDRKVNNIFLRGMKAFISLQNCGFLTHRSSNYDKQNTRDFLVVYKITDYSQGVARPKHFEFQHEYLSRYQTDVFIIFFVNDA